MNAPLDVLIAEIEHTATLAIEDGSKVTQSKLDAHLRQYGEALMKERDGKPAGRWKIEKVKQTDEATWVCLSETQYVADEPWPKVGQTLEEVR